MEVNEVIRRWQAGESQRSIARSTALSRNTVEKYVRLAEAVGVTPTGEPPGESTLASLVRRTEPGRPASDGAPAQAVLTVHEARIAKWLHEERLRLTRIQELLIRDGVTVSYTTLRRYVMSAGLWKQPSTTVRMPDWPPGEVAEMDFGKLGILVDAESGKRQVVWALVVVLPYSRHSFVWPMLQQTLPESIEGLEAAWRSFAGVPKRLIIDNFPAAVAGPDRYEPRLTRGFLEYSQVRGFLADPARVRSPKDKPHVERHIQYVRERFFKGGSFRDLADCREQAKAWCKGVAGLRVHGTTRKLPLDVFEADERDKLQPHDGVIYDVPLWKEVTVHPDHHISYRYSLYSAPSTSCPAGTKLEVRGDGKLVKLYRLGTLVKVHTLQPKGGRATDPNDYPAEKTTYALRAPDAVVKKATLFGPNVGEFAKKLFAGPVPWSNLRQGQKLISLGDKYTGERLDAACARALDYQLINVRRLQGILLKALDAESPRLITTEGPPLSARFAREASAFDHHAQEAAR